MNTEDMMKQISVHPINCELGVEMALGFPFYRMFPNGFHVIFYPHIERIGDNVSAFHSPAYRLEFVYPFRHLCRFDNLVLCGIADADADEICKEGESFVQDFKRLKNEIYICSDRILEEVNNRHGVRTKILKDYRDCVYNAVHALGLERIYGAEAE